MEKYFREVSRLFADYKTLSENLRVDYEKQQASGNYNRAFLNKLFADNTQKKQQERNKINKRISSIREEFAEELYKKYDLEIGFISPKLQGVLNSGIKLTENELLRMAERHKNNLAESRLLHDYAQNKHLTLRNYITVEECLQNFDNYAMHVRNSMDENNLLPMFQDAKSAELSAGAYCGKCMTPPMDIYPTPSTIEGIIARDIADTRKETDAKINDRVFVEGFTGKKQEEQKAEDTLTEVEKEDARALSIGRGKNGEITEEEVEYIHSRDYAKIREERTQENTTSE